MQPLKNILLASASLLSLAISQDVEFFYTETLDLCEINGVSIEANEQTTHGGICAYRKDVDKVYGCPAPDPMCWTWADDCSNSGVGQAICNRGGTVFCCNAVAGDTCTTTEGQINVCISNFTSPNSGVNVDTANGKYLKAIDMSNVTATSQSTEPSPFSTRNLVSTSAPSTSMPTSSASTTSTTTSTTSGTSSAGSDASSSTSGVTSVSVTESKSGISGGAIAGIVIGALAVIAMIGGAFFFLGRRRRHDKSASPDSKDNSNTQPYAQGFENKHASDYHNIHTPASELEHQSNTRVEMPVSFPAEPKGRIQQPQELA